MFYTLLRSSKNTRKYLILKAHGENSINFSAGNQLCVSEAFPELNLFILIWPPHPWSCVQTQLFPCISVQTHLIHFAECHVLGFQETALFLEPFNRFLSVQNNNSIMLQGVQPDTECAKCLGKKQNFSVNGALMTVTPPVQPGVVWSGEPLSI